MKEKLKIVAWFLFALVLVVLMVFAGKAQQDALVLEPTIAISVVDENNFLTGEELMGRLKRNQLIYEGQKMRDLNTTNIEALVRKMHEVEEVQVFKQMAGHWTIRLKIRQPFARVFNAKGESYYIDSKGSTMNVSPNFTARVLIISGNIPDRCDSITVADLANNDSLSRVRQLDDMYRLAKYINRDEFLNAQISQIQRNQFGDYIMIPLVGDQEIIFGTAKNEASVKQRLEKLKIFYKQGLPYEGWEKYETINLKYKNQIVCKRRQEAE